MPSESSAGSETDEALVRRAAAGDTSAFASLVRRHESRVYAVCLRVLGDPDDAADAAQDALLTVYRKLGQFRGDARFTTWLHRVSVNACYDQLRKRRRQPLLRPAGDDDERHDEGTPHPDPADEIAGTHDAAAALALVPEEFRVALVLADVEDLPYDEIARVLDVPVGTVKSRVHRGRIALAKVMGLDAREPQLHPETSEREP
ncbi:MAG TPA: sigma-70 family RNA polymerase sigma factor [Actinomycetota bacterium]